METHKNKKDSVFSGIFPSNEPAPPQEAVPHAYKPAVSEEQVAALNSKIELMESNIVGRIERKLAEQVPLSPPPPALAPAVLLKITEMENRFKDFQEKFLLGAAQMKNIEESKISARREIEELLKVVREQQKYTELDRQMHDQLEKAWARVEEMDKRLMEVYAAAAKKPAEPSAPAVSAAEISAAVLAAVDARLTERLAPLETMLKSASSKPEAAPAVSAAEIAAAVQATVDSRLTERLSPFEAMLKSASSKLEAAPAAARRVEGRVEELSADVETRLSDFSYEIIRQLHSETFAAKERMEELLAEVRKDVLSSVREAVTEGSGAFLRHVDAAALDGREMIDALGKLMVGHLDELSARGAAGALKLDVLESCVKAEGEKALSAVSAVRPALEKFICAQFEAAAAGRTAENSAQLEKIQEAYGLSASNAAAISGVAKNISEIEERLGGVLSELKAFIRALEPINLEAVLGVSGAILRGSFKSVVGLTAGLEKEMVLLAGAKGGIEENLKSLAPKPGRGDK